jgi:DNA primase
VSAPCTWEEVASGEVAPRTFTLINMGSRMEAAGDLWSGMRRRRRSLQPAMQKLTILLEKEGVTAT